MITSQPNQVRTEVDEKAIQYPDVDKQEVKGTSPGGEEREGLAEVEPAGDMMGA